MKEYAHSGINVKNICDDALLLECIPHDFSTLDHCYTVYIQNSSTTYRILYCDANEKLITGKIYWFSHYKLFKTFYVQDGEIHRDDGPAVICEAGDAYYLHNQIIGANLKQKTFEKLKDRFYKELVFK